MAYQNVNFPALKLIQGMIKEPIVPVIIIGNGNKERRIQMYSSPRYRFVFPSRTLKASEAAGIITFLNSVKWETDSFNFTTPPDHNGATVTYKVRLEAPVSIQTIAVDSNRRPLMYALSDIKLLTVVGE